LVHSIHIFIFIFLDIFFNLLSPFLKVTSSSCGNTNPDSHDQSMSYYESSNGHNTPAMSCNEILPWQQLQQNPSNAGLGI